MVAAILAAAKTLLLSYSQILFAASLPLGAAVAVASFVTPGLGLMGLLGAVAANTWAFALGLDRPALAKGLFGYNGVLTGLALGALFAPEPRFFLLLVVCCFALVLLSAALNYALLTYFGIPAMSAPFALVTWMVILSAINIGNLSPASEVSALALLPQNLVPDILYFFLSNFSAVLFQTSALTGLILIVGILFHSRYAAFLMAGGFTAAFLTHQHLGLKETLLHGYALPLSSMFAALAIGGIFSVPGPSSALLAMLGAILSVFTLSAAHSVLPEYLPPYTIPYTITVFLIVLALRLRSRPALGIHLVTAEAKNPEGNLRAFRRQRNLASLATNPIGLPFSGRWRVSQGFCGKHTHQGLWKYGCDFQAVDADNRIYTGSGLCHSDYFGFGKPVLAPADGTVTGVESDIPDNPIGVVNSQRNWGNHLIIEHAPGWYSCLAHLKQGSIRVSPGTKVRKGQVIALCGNSGRSAYPHLHLQFQTSPLLGSPTWPFSFSNVTVERHGERIYLWREILKEGDIAMNPSFLSNPPLYFPLISDRKWHYRYKGEKEIWSLSVDPLGMMILDSAPRRTILKFWYADGTLTVTEVKGSKKTGLHLLGSYFPKLPFLAPGEHVSWKTQNGASRFELTSAMDALSIQRLKNRKFKTASNVIATFSADAGIEIRVDDERVLHSN